MKLSLGRSSPAISWRSSSWPGIGRDGDRDATVRSASETLVERAAGFGDQPSVALLGPEGVDWLLRGTSDGLALLWADPACLREVLAGRATILGALLAGAARCEATAPAWEWTRQQAMLHEGAASAIGRLPADGRTPRELRPLLLPVIAATLRDQLRFNDHQESIRSEVHVRWVTPKGKCATTKVAGGVYEVHDGRLEGEALEVRIDEPDVQRVLRREVLIPQLVLEGRVVLDGNVEAVASLPTPQF